MNGFKTVAGTCNVKTSPFLGNFGIFRLFLAVLDNPLHIFDLCRADQGCATPEKGWKHFLEHFAMVSKLLQECARCGRVLFCEIFAFSVCFLLFRTILCTSLTCPGLIRAVRHRERVGTMFWRICEWFQNCCRNVQG